MRVGFSMARVAKFVRIDRNKVLFRIVGVLCENLISHIYFDVKFGTS